MVSEEEVQEVQDAGRKEPGKRGGRDEAKEEKKWRGLEGRV
jgi:hypothetical protein